ncbi:MAG: hypothetical protein HPY66_0117 [Firmicutes bacterium]|nr:hypothetical protein [Bacillota bacterium]
MSPFGFVKGRGVLAPFFSNNTFFRSYIYNVNACSILKEEG